MALYEIRRRIVDSGAGHLLDLLPSVESVRWETLAPASPPTALVLGTVAGRDILAFLLKFGDKPRGLRYCSKPINRTIHSSNVRSLLQDEVVELQLDPPFRYNTDLSQSGKRRFSMIIRWYFLAKGLIGGQFGDYDDYSKRFTVALRMIEAGQQAEKSDQELRSQRLQVELTPKRSNIEPDKPMNIYVLRSGGHENRRNEHKSHDRDGVSHYDGKETNSSQSTATQLPSPSEATSSSSSVEEENRDLNKLHKYLDTRGVLHLLQNIPEADEVQFADQDSIPPALPKKLFVGHTKTDPNEIYAYMRPARNHHQVNFYSENLNGSSQMISAEQVMKQQIYHPFNKTFPEDLSSIDQSDKARLSILIKWYFLATGVAHNIILKEIKAYPERLRHALEYISKRMEHIQSTSTSVTHRTPITRGTPVTPMPRPEPSVDTISGGTSSNPVVTATLHRTTASIPTSPTKVQRNTSQSSSATRNRKRTAADAGFEGLARIYEQDQDLTKQINDADQELEVLDMQCQNFEEKVEMQRKQFMDKKQEVMERRNELNRKRVDGREKFKRQSLTVWDSDD